MRRKLDHVAQPFILISERHPLRVTMSAKKACSQCKAAVSVKQKMSEEHVVVDYACVYIAIRSVYSLVHMYMCTICVHASRGLNFSAFHCNVIF